MGKIVQPVPELREMTLEQRRQLTDTQQIWQAVQQARIRVRSYTGSVTWKAVNGHDYLVKKDGPETKRRERSLGPRSESTESVFGEFTSGKSTAKQHLAQTTSRLGELARINRAMRLARVPSIAAKIARVLHQREVLGRTVTIVGTHAIFAYEAEAGVFVDTAMLATGDLDILYDARARLRLRGETEPPALLEMLKQADRSFERAGPRGSFSAINSEGYLVDLIKAPPRDVVTSTEPDALGGADDLQAAHIPNMRWVANAPKFEAMAIGADGFPVPLSCPDPRAFALYKLWMGTRDPTRSPVKRLRDVAQAHAVAAIVHRYLPMLPFEPEHLTCFPKEAAELAEEADFFLGRETT